MKYAEDVDLEKDNPKFAARMTRALERRAEPAIPADFAARVVASLPPAQPARKTAHVGRTVGLVAGGVLAVAMFAIAPHAAPTFASLAFDFELVIIAQLAGIGYWLSVGSLKRLR